MEFVDVIDVDDVDVGQEDPNLGGGGGMSVMEGVLSIVGRGGGGGGVPESDDPRRSVSNLPSNNDAETSKLLMPPLPPPLPPPWPLGRESSMPLAYRATKLQIKQLPLPPRYKSGCNKLRRPCCCDELPLPLLPPINISRVRISLHLR